MALRELTIKMLKRDDELRLGAATQRLYSRCGEMTDQKVRITEAVQRRVAREFGFETNIAEGLEVMRCATAMFPDDAEVRNSAHYLRHNIHSPCPIAVGEVIPDIHVRQQSNGESLSLHALCSSFDGPTLLLAGSIT